MVLKLLKLNLKVTKQKQHTQIPIPRNSIFPKGCVRVEEKVEINNNNDYENDPFMSSCPAGFSVYTLVCRYHCVTGRTIPLVLEPTEMDNILINTN